MYTTSLWRPQTLPLICLRGTPQYVEHKQAYARSVLRIRRPLWLSLLGIFTVVSSVPTHALAFESQLAVSPAPSLTLPVQLKRGDIISDIFINAPLSGTHQHLAVRTIASPITERGHWPQKSSATAVTQIPATPKVMPEAGNPVVMQGEASYYSREGCLGCNPLRIMANGQPLNDNALTMAIGADKKHLVGRQARVTSVATGKSVTVIITDTGGFYQAKYGHRVADLTIATKQAIGMNGGVGQVRVEVY